MDAKKLLLLTVLMALLSGAYCFAADTTITGTMSCFMPELIELQPAAQATSVQTPTPDKQDTVSPVVYGASGNYEVQKEEKLIQTEKTLGDKVTVYTVSAR